MFNLEDYSTNETDETNLDNDTGTLSIKTNGWLWNIWEVAKAAIRFKIVKFALFGIFTGIFLIATGDFTRSRNMAEDASSKGANEDYFGLAAFFAKETGHKSAKLNIHPFYHTKGVRSLEAKYKVDFGRDIKFSKVFAYVVYEDQDFMVMKGPARGKDNEKLKLEYSTLFGVSASDYCEDYFNGFVPDEEVRKAVVKSLRVRKIKDELTEDNDDGEKMFRCVIDPDVIEDFVENEKED